MDVAQHIMCDRLGIHTGRLRVALSRCEDGEQAIITYRHCRRCERDIPEDVTRESDLVAGQLQ